MGGLAGELAPAGPADPGVQRVDDMTMAWGLEARTPFLDHDLVDRPEGYFPVPALSDLMQGGLLELRLQTHAVDGR